METSIGVFNKQRVNTIKIRGDEYVKVYQVKEYEDKNPGKLEAIGVSGYYLDKNGLFHAVIEKETVNQVIIKNKIAEIIGDTSNIMIEVQDS